MGINQYILRSEKMKAGDPFPLKTQKNPSLLVYKHLGNTVNVFTNINISLSLSCCWDSIFHLILYIKVCWFCQDHFQAVALRDVDHLVGSENDSILSIPVLKAYCERIAQQPVIRRSISLSFKDKLLICDDRATSLKCPGCPSNVLDDMSILDSLHLVIFSSHPACGTRPGPYSLGGQWTSSISLLLNTC